jgi:hypothetical protein
LRALALRNAGPGHLRKALCRAHRFHLFRIEGIELVGLRLPFRSLLERKYVSGARLGHQLDRVTEFGADGLQAFSQFRTRRWIEPFGKLFLQAFRVSSDFLLVGLPARRGCLLLCSGDFLLQLLLLGGSGAIGSVLTLVG